MYTLYGIKNCDSVKKARTWLDKQAQTYHFHDYRVDGLSPELLAHFIDAVGWESLLNQRSTSWRQLSAEQKSDLTADKAMQLMIDNPTLIKRPLLETGNGMLVGFDAAAYAKLL